MSTLKIVFPPAILSEDKKPIRKALRAAGRVVQVEAQNLIRSSAGGPGNPPKNRTGTLARSMRISMKGMAARVTDQDGGSLALETGAVGGGGDTKNKANILLAGEIGKRGQVLRDKNRMKASAINKTRRMAARPFLSVALAKKADEITRRITEAIDQGIEFKATKP